MATGIKHLVECHCILPQFRDKETHTYHRFIVFSVIDDDDNVIPKHVQCNNCGVVHFVTDLTKSSIISGNDNDASVMSIDDIKLSLPENVSHILSNYNVDLPTWEQVSFLLENEKWNSKVILSSDAEGNPDGAAGKLLRIVSPISIKIEPYVIKHTV